MAVVSNIDATVAGRRGFFVRWRDGFYRWYRQMTLSRWFTKIILKLLYSAGDRIHGSRIDPDVRHG